MDVKETKKEIKRMVDSISQKSIIQIIHKFVTYYYLRHGGK